jgi:hypothetical protein
MLLRLVPAATLCSSLLGLSASQMCNQLIQVILIA